jgi:hypothetical protein
MWISRVPPFNGAIFIFLITYLHSRVSPGSHFGFAKLPPYTL